VEFTSLARPGSLPQFVECNSGATVGEPKCLPAAQDMPLYCVDPHYASTRIPGSYGPLYCVRLPALKQTDFGLSPVPHRGNVVAHKELVWRKLIHNAIFIYPSPPFLHFPRHNFLKTFQWNRALFQGFRNPFVKSQFSVPILEFWAPLQVFRRR
jgi:hypothetical protein